MFSQYPSICNVQRAPSSDFGQSMWYVTEKVHGANLQFCVSQNGIRVGRRTAFLGGNKSEKHEYKSDDNSELKAFHKADVILEELRSGLLNLFENVHAQDGSVSQVVVYGEIYGGVYPGVKNTMKRVQHGVYYCNIVRFIAFDIEVVHCEESETKHFLPHTQCVELCNRFCIPVLQVIFSGSMEECFKWSALHNSDSSEIHKLHGLPLIENNVREGNVIKPHDSVFNKGIRVIYKDKNTKWCETSKSMKKDFLQSASMNQQELVLDAALYITQARLDNVCSKLMPDAPLHHKMRELVQDAYIEFMLDHPDSNLQKQINQVLYREAKLLLKF